MRRARSRARSPTLRAPPWLDCRSARKQSRPVRGRTRGRAPPCRYRKSWTRYKLASLPGCVGQSSCGPRRALPGCESSLSFPSHSVLGVFEQDSLRRQFVANLIAARKVSRLLGLPSFRDQRLDLLIGYRSILRGGAHHVEDGIESLQQRGGGTGIAREELT